MPVRGASLNEVLRPFLDHELARHGGLELFDAHTHIGRNDPDGYSAEPNEILAAMDAAGRPSTWPRRTLGYGSCWRMPASATSGRSPMRSATRTTSSSTPRGGRCRT